MSVFTAGQFKAPVPAFGSSISWECGGWTHEVVPAGHLFRWKATFGEGEKQIATDLGVYPGGVYQALFSLLYAADDVTPIDGGAR